MAFRHKRRWIGFFLIWAAFVALVVAAGHLLTHQDAYFPVLPSVSWFLASGALAKRNARERPDRRLSVMG